MRVLVACEFSGVVREAFRARGHDAWSCDLLASEDGSAFHYREDVREILDLGWNLMVAHPPCTHLAVSGARWFPEKRQEQAEALEFVRTLLNAPIRRIAIENPVSIISTHIRRPDQIIQPWQHGHKEMKTTCLWLKNLPLLKPTGLVGPPPPLAERDRAAWEPLHWTPPGPDRWKIRSTTYTGIAEAMATQWSAPHPIQTELAL
jgi:hypothetical protein